MHKVVIFFKELNTETYGLVENYQNEYLITHFYLEGRSDLFFSFDRFISNGTS